MSKQDTLLIHSIQSIIDLSLFKRRPILVRKEPTYLKKANDNLFVVLSC